MILQNLVLNVFKNTNLCCITSINVRRLITRICCVLVITAVFAAFFNLDSAFAAMEGCGDSANPAVRTICEIIIFLQGRIGRSLVVFMIMISAWSFVSGNFKWQEMVTLAIGIGIFFNPKTFTLFLLPSYIVGISSDGFDINTKYTPDEILLCYCPELT